VISSKFSPQRIRVATLAVALTCIYLGYQALNGNPRILSYAFPILLGVCLIGMKWAAPRIPWLQLLAALFVVFTVDAFFGWLGHATAIPVIVLAADKVIEAFCVLGFGAYWVTKGYIPLAANKW